VQPRIVVGTARTYEASNSYIKFDVRPYQVTAPQPENADLTGAQWRKSTRSGANGSDCGRMQG
jgi:hypothetical protein